MADHRFAQQLRQQLSFIGNSCRAYDDGQRHEAIRIGTSLRVLFHDTKRSTSLLLHLHATDVPIVSSCGLDVDPNNPPMAFDGLMSFSGAGISPKLDRGSRYREMPAPDWWGQPVIGAGRGKVLSRAMIALTAANKDGGAHVDESVPDEYLRLVDGVWTQAGPTGSRQVSDHHLLCLRQMGWEVLNSPKLLALSA